MRLFLPCSSCQNTTPRLTLKKAYGSFLYDVSSAAGSNSHFCWPVAAFIANSFSLGEVPYIMPSTIIGLPWFCERLPVSLSLVVYVQATCSCETLSAVICSLDEYLMPSLEPA